MKRKLIALFLILAMLLPCLSMTTAAAETEPLKVLAIGNSFSNDATWLLPSIFRAEGVDELVLGNLYIGGCTIQTHWANARDNKADYVYYKNVTGEWETNNDVSILTALKDEDWDVIVMQQGVIDAGLPTTYNEDLDNLISYIEQNKTNPNAKLAWHMTWSHQKTRTNDPLFGEKFNFDQFFFYEGIANSVRTQIGTRSAIDLMIPAGTAVQHARATALGDTLNRDGYHLSTLGRVIDSYLWFSILTGKKLDVIHYTDIPAVPSTSALTLTEEDANYVVQAVNAAIEKPYGEARSLYEIQTGDVFYFAYPPTADEFATGYVFGSDTVADGTEVIVRIPKGTVTEESNAYAAQFWYEDGGKLVNVSGADKCGGQFGLHDVITSIENNTITLDDGTHKSAATCTLGSAGSCGSEGRTGQCAAQLALSDKLTIVDLRVAALNGTESAVTTADAVKALCDDGKAVVNTYAPDGKAQALVVLDHTLKVTATQPEEVSLVVDTADGWTDETGVAYGSVGMQVTVSVPAEADYKLMKVQVDEQPIKTKAFFINGNHTVTGTVEKKFQGDVYYFIDPVDMTKECEAIILHSDTLPLGLGKVTPTNGKGTLITAHHFWEMMDAEKSPLKRFAGAWVSYTNKYRYGYHDIIAIYDHEGHAVTLDSPPDTHRSKTTCGYSKASGYTLPGQFDETCGTTAGRGYECAAYLKLADDLKIYDLRGEVLAGLAPAAADVPAIKALCDEGKAVVNTFTLDGTAEGGTVSAFILVDPAPFMTRGEAVQALYEQAGKPAVTGEIAFSDVSADSQYAAAINWAAQTGLVAGYGDSKFGTEDKLTVEQLAVILWKQAGKPTAASAPEGIKCSTWASEALGWCAANGILNNVTCEDATANTASTQTAQMLANFSNR